MHAQRRYNRKLRTWQEACHAVDALNLLYGCQRDRQLGEGKCSPSLAQAHRQVHQHIIQRIAKLRPLATPTGSAAARELFGSCYDYVGDSCSVAPYDEAKVSLPDGSLNPVMLADVLAEKTMGHLILSSMLADDDTVMERREQGAAAQYTDEAMRGDPGLLRDFCLRLLTCGVAGVTSVCEETVSPFFFGKRAIGNDWCSTAVGSTKSSGGHRLRISEVESASPGSVQWSERGVFPGRWARLVGTQARSRARLFTLPMRISKTVSINVLCLTRGVTTSCLWRWIGSG